MKVFFIALLLTATIPCSVQAQRADQQRPGNEGSGQMMKSPEQRAEKQTDKMARALNLTTEQRKSIYDANLKAARQMQPLIDQMPANRNRMKAIHQDREAAIRQTLTATQWDQYEAHKAERRQRRMEMKGRPEGEGRDFPGYGNEPAPPNR